jgi:hypothetical protein
MKKMLTFTITVLMLGASFGIVYALSDAQIKNASNRYLSILISLVISIINIIIGSNYLFYCRGYKILDKLREELHSDQASD